MKHYSRLLRYCIQSTFSAWDWVGLTVLVTLIMFTLEMLGVSYFVSSSLLNLGIKSPGIILGLTYLGYALLVLPLYEVIRAVILYRYAKKLAAQYMVKVDSIVSAICEHGFMKLSRKVRTNMTHPSYHDWSMSVRETHGLNDG